MTDPDPLLAFPSELQPAAAASEGTSTTQTAASAPEPASARTTPAWLLFVAGAALATAGFITFELTRDRWLPRNASAGALTVDTQPAGADVVIDGRSRGVTPLTVSLEPGEHSVAVRLDGHERARPVTLSAGGTAAQFFDLTALATRSPDDLASPLTPVATASSPLAEAATPPPGSVGGWLTVEAPFEVRVLEGDEVVGVSSTSRIMLTAGRHQVTFSNPALEYVQTASVNITPGRRTTFVVDPPKVNLNVNAQPWADVTIDNTEAGQTPIANLPVALGSHQVVFRHPQFGERRQTVVVTAKGPNRVSMDMTQGR